MHKSQAVAMGKSHVLGCILLLSLFATTPPATAELYTTNNKSGLLGSTFFLSLQLLDELEKSTDYEAQVGLTPVAFASNVHQFREILLWLRIKDIAGAEILEITATTEGVIEDEGVSFWTNIPFSTTNFPDTVIFSLAVTFKEVDLEGGLNSNTINYSEMTTYNFPSTTSSRTPLATEDDSNFSILSFILGISTAMIIHTKRKQ